MTLLYSTIAVYCRVSSRWQKNDSQEAEIRRWLEANGIDPDAVTWYFDKESGGSSSAKPSTACNGTSSRERSRPWWYGSWTA